MKLILFFCLIIATLVYGQSDVPLTLRAQFNGSYGYTIIGNTHNSFDNWQNPTPPCQMLTQSSATLNLQPNQTIVAAYLYWSGVGDGTLNQNINLNNTAYNSQQTLVGYPENNLIIDYFSSYSDVSNQVISTGNGVYNVSNLNLNSILNNYCSTSNYYGGWYIVIVYEQAGLLNQQINIYDGINVVSNLFNNGNTTLTINNLAVVDSQDARITYTAWNGSINLYFNESIFFNNNILSNALNPQNNPFNSTNSFTGSTTNWNQDIDTFDISSFINVGDTQASIVFKSFYYRFVQTLVTSIRSELPDATVQLNQVSGQEVCNNRNLLVNYIVKNTNSNAVLPANVPVSFYANNVLLSTIFTPTPIAIGAVLPLQTTVAVPISVSNTFNLRVVVDNAVGVFSTIAESNEANNDSSQSVTFSTTLITPVFALSKIICANSPSPVLPSSSTNGILGTWVPAVVSNQNSGIYEFTPNAGQCAVPFTLSTTVTVLPIIAPVFSGLQNTFCRGASVPALPVVSSNGLSGTWSPSVISNENGDDYDFTPSANQCGLPFTLSVTINTVVAPTFSIANTFCVGATVPVLPTVSDNGISGSWLPSIVSNASNGRYVFSPSVGLCASSSTLDVTINQFISPTFNLPLSICQNAVAPVLSVSSTNNIIGTWTPSMVSNQTSGRYEFMPTQNIGLCALPFIYILDVVPQIPAVSEVFICSSVVLTAAVPAVLDSGLDLNDFSFAWTLNNAPIAQSTTSISVAAAGNYELVATPIGLGCPKVFQFTVTAYLRISATYVVSDDFALDQTITVQATGGSGAYEYSFNNQPFQNYNVFSTADGGDINVIVRDNTDCAELTKTITAWQYPRFFSPNNDGYNDTWGIKTQKKIRIDIFDRFGKLLKQLNNGDPWNGFVNSQPLPADDYWFVVFYDEGKSFKGNFSLKR